MGQKFHPGRTALLPANLILRLVGLFLSPSKFATNLTYVQAKIVNDSRKADIKQVLYVKPLWLLTADPVTFR
jgi:hypothetical protein